MGVPQSPQNKIEASNPSSICFILIVFKVPLLKAKAVDGTVKFSDVVDPVILRHGRQ